MFFHENVRLMSQIFLKFCQRFDLLVEFFGFDDWESYACQ